MTNDINVIEELNVYEWTRARWTATKLIGPSPFRPDTHPSFFVDLRTGGWHDSGAVDPEWQSGNFAKLLGFLRGTDEAEAREYLRMKYGTDAGHTYGITEESPQLRPLKLSVAKSYKPLDMAVLEPYKFRHPYLARRGISESVQRLMRIGYDKQSRAVTIPWFNADGTLGNVMYRKIEGKTFWYARGGRPTSEMLYGIDVIYSRNIRRAAIVEAPIDAMTVMTAGFAALAVGGTAFSIEKRDLIIRSPIEELTIVRDNDGPGRLLQRRIIAELSPHMTVKIAVVPQRYGKDVNDAGTGVIRRSMLRAREVKTINLRKISA